MKKLIAVILCLIMCVSVFASCKKADGGDSSADTSKEQSAATSTEESSAESSEESSEDSSEESGEIEHVADATIYGKWYAFMDGVEFCMDFNEDKILTVTIMGVESTGAFKTNGGKVYIEDIEIFEGVVMTYAVDGIKLSLTDEEGETVDFYQRSIEAEEVIGYWGGINTDYPEVFYLDEGGWGEYKYRGSTFPAEFSIRGDVVYVSVDMMGIQTMEYEFTVDGGTITAKDGKEFYSLLPAEEFVGVWEESGRNSGYYIVFDEIGAATFYESTNSYFLYDVYDNIVCLMFRDEEDGEVYYIEPEYTMDGYELTIDFGETGSYTYTKRIVDSDVVGYWVQEDAEDAESAISLTFYEGGFGIYALGELAVTDILYTAKDGKMDMTVVANLTEQKMEATYERQGDKLAVTMEGETIIFVNPYMTESAE